LGTSGGGDITIDDLGEDGNDDDDDDNDDNDDDELFFFFSSFLAFPFLFFQDRISRLYLDLLRLTSSLEAFSFIMMLQSLYH
jgi:hypothetical protein